MRTYALPVILLRTQSICLNSLWLKSWLFVHLLFVGIWSDTTWRGRGTLSTGSPSWTAGSYWAKLTRLLASKLALKDSRALLARLTLTYGTLIKSCFFAGLCFFEATSLGSMLSKLDFAFLVDFMMPVYLNFLLRDSNFLQRRREFASKGFSFMIRVSFFF